MWGHSMSDHPMLETVPPQILIKSYIYVYIYIYIYIRMTRIGDPYNLRSFGKVFSEILTLKKCQIGVFWAQPP